MAVLEVARRGDQAGYEADQERPEGRKEDPHAGWDGGPHSPRDGAPNRRHDLRDGGRRSGVGGGLECVVELGLEGIADVGDDEIAKVKRVAGPTRAVGKVGADCDWADLRHRYISSSPRRRLR